MDDDDDGDTCPETQCAANTDCGQDSGQVCCPTEHCGKVCAPGEMISMVQKLCFPGW